MSIFGTFFDTALEARMTAVEAAMPIASTATPAGIADAGAVGTVPSKFSIEGHVHPSKLRKERVACSAATLTWIYPTPFDAGVVPIVNGIAETTVGVTDLYNIQIDGTPTNTSCKFRITRYQQSVVALIGLTILSFNSSPGSIYIHAEAFQP